MVQIKTEQEQKVLVYDLGGGTFDVSILDLYDGTFDVLATAGNNRLGGDDFDKKVMDYMVSEFKKENGVDLSADKMAMQRVKDAAEKAKKDLSGMMQTQISLPYITAGANGPLHFQILTLTRAKFDELTADLVAKTEVPVRQALTDAKVSASEIDQILLVGGSTRIIAVQESVKKKEISERHARALLKLEDTAQQNNMLKEILEQNLTVDETEKRIAKLLTPKKRKTTCT